MSDAASQPLRRTFAALAAPRTAAAPGGRREPPGRPRDLGLLPGIDAARRCVGETCALPGSAP